MSIYSILNCYLFYIFRSEWNVLYVFYLSEGNVLSWNSWYSLSLSERNFLSLKLVFCYLFLREMFYLGNVLFCLSLSEGGQTRTGGSSGSDVYKLSHQRGHSTRTPSQLTFVHIQIDRCFLSTSTKMPSWRGGQPELQNHLSSQC